VVSHGEKPLSGISHTSGLMQGLLSCPRSGQDVDVALRCDVDFVSIFIATSDLHLKYKYHKTFEEAESCP